MLLSKSNCIKLFAKEMDDIYFAKIWTSKDCSFILNSFSVLMKRLMSDKIENRRSKFLNVLQRKLR